MPRRGPSATRCSTSATSGPSASRYPGTSRSSTSSSSTAPPGRSIRAPRRSPMPLVTSNNVKTAITCPGSFTCAEPPLPPPGVFDWRDAVIYFVFIDRFFDGEPANNCNVSGTSPTSTSSTNYLGGDWAGVTQKINSGYFSDLGVNTLWITVPIKNADDVLGAGVVIDRSGDPQSDGTNTPPTTAIGPELDPTADRAVCFGSDRRAQGARGRGPYAKNLKVLFDYAMVHVHTSSSLYTAHQNDGWFTSGANACICGATRAACNVRTRAAGSPTTSRTTTIRTPRRARSPSTPPSSSCRRTAMTPSGSTRSSRSTRAGSRRCGRPSPRRSWPRSRRCSASTWSARRTTSRIVAEIKSMIDSSTSGSMGSSIPSRSGSGSSRALLTAWSTQGNMLTPDDLELVAQRAAGDAGARAVHGLERLRLLSASPDCRHEHVHREPRSPPLDSLRGGHAALVELGRQRERERSGASQPPALSTNANAYERFWPTPSRCIFTNKGAPLIYYGDEIGLPGAGDPDNRRMMQWSGFTAAEQQALLARMQALLSRSACGAPGDAARDARP